MKEETMVRAERIEKSILLIRKQKVMLDADLAKLYGVETRRLNEQVRRNIDRFPEDFMFQLTREEFDNLKSQIATSSEGWGGRRKLPFAFTEHGAVMAASVLNTPRAIEFSVYVVRAFVKLREMMSTRKRLTERFAELEQKLATHDEQILSIVAAIRQLMGQPVPSRRRIGFRADGRE